MPTAVTFDVTISRPQLLPKLREGFAKPADLLLPIGVAGMAGMANQLVNSYSTHAEAHRTNNLLRSLSAGGPGGGEQSIFDLKPSSVTIGSSVEYAAIQDEGGTVRAKTVKNLAVPLNRQVKVRGMWPRDFPADSLSFIPAKTPGRIIGFLVDASGTLGLGEGPLFALMPSVDIPPKHLARAGRERILDELDEIYAAWIDDIDRRAA